jgi:hypothetical protein
MRVRFVGASHDGLLRKVGVGRRTARNEDGSVLRIVVSANEKEDRKSELTSRALQDSHRVEVRVSVRVEIASAIRRSNTMNTSTSEEES